MDLNYAAHDPTFSPTTGGRTLAYLVKPHGEGPFAGVIYLHWLGAGNSTRAQFLDEAVAMAQRGAIGLLVQGYFPWMANPAGDERDRPLITGQVAELRRAIDFLLVQPGVDPDRLGFVGHDFGATYGGTLAGVEQPPKDLCPGGGGTQFLGLRRPVYPSRKILPDHPRSRPDPICLPGFSSKRFLPIWGQGWLAGKGHRYGILQCRQRTKEARMVRRYP